MLLVANLINRCTRRVSIYIILLGVGVLGATVEQQVYYDDYRKSSG